MIILHIDTLGSILTHGGRKRQHPPTIIEALPLSPMAQCTVGDLTGSARGESSTLASRLCAHLRLFRTERKSVRHLPMAEANSLPCPRPLTCHLEVELLGGFILGAPSLQEEGGDHFFCRHLGGALSSWPCNQSQWQAPQQQQKQQACLLILQPERGPL